MKALQEVIDAIGCFETKQKPCAGCPFNPVPGTQWAYGCQKGERDIVEAARSALRILMEVMADDECMAPAADRAGQRDDRDVPDSVDGGEQEGR